MHVTSTTFLQILVPLLHVVYRDCFSATFAIYRSSCRLSSVTATSTPLRIVLSLDSSIRRDRAFFFFFFFFFRSLFVIFLFFSFRATRKTPAANVFIANLQFPLHKIRAHHPYFSLSLSLLPLIFKGLADDSMQFISTKAPVKFNIGRRYVEEIRVSSSPFRPFQ